MARKTIHHWFEDEQRAMLLQVDATAVNELLADLHSNYRVQFAGHMAGGGYYVHRFGQVALAGSRVSTLAIAIREARKRDKEGGS